LVSSRGEALAWGQPNYRNDPYRHSGTARWQDRGLVGEGKRRTIPWLKHPENLPGNCFNRILFGIKKYWFNQMGYSVLLFPKILIEPELSKPKFFLE
jgi:hypothetical protein